MSKPSQERIERSLVFLGKCLSDVGESGPVGALRDAHSEVNKIATKLFEDN